MERIERLQPSIRFPKLTQLLGISDGEVKEILEADQGKLILVVTWQQAEEAERNAEWFLQRRHRMILHRRQSRATRDQRR